MFTFTPFLALCLYQVVLVTVVDKCIPKSGCCHCPVYHLYLCLAWHTWESVADSSEWCCGRLCQLCWCWPQYLFCILTEVGDLKTHSVPWAMTSGWFGTFVAVQFCYVACNTNASHMLQSAPHWFCSGKLLGWMLELPRTLWPGVQPMAHSSTDSSYRVWRV